MEANIRYVGYTDYIFSWLEQPGSQAVTSALTLTELLVQPYRNANQRLVDEFYGLLSRYPNLEWVVPTLEIADIAARIRALYRLRTPDALQAATAERNSATGFITNDPIFRRIGTFETLILDELI
jgi:predicted nucleic acid-binding protein